MICREASKGAINGNFFRLDNFRRDFGGCCL